MAVAHQWLKTGIILVVFLVFFQTGTKGQPLWEGSGLDDITTTMSEKQQHFLQKILRYEPMKDTTLGRIIQGERFPDVEKLQQMSIQTIIDELSDDRRPELRQLFMDKLQGAPQAGYRSVPEEGSYESCEIDYGAFVKPVTHDVFRILCEIIICGSLPPGIPCPICPGIQVPEQQPWGPRMIDAMAKIPEGIGGGQLHWVGAAEYCEETEVTYNVTYDETTGELSERSFTGKYYRLDLTPFNANISLLFGVCAPDTCSAEHVRQFIYDDLLLSFLLDNVLNMNITFVYGGRDLDFGSDSRVQTAVAIIGALAALVVLATIWDAFFRTRWLKQTTQDLLSSLKENKDDVQKTGRNSVAPIVTEPEKKVYITQMSQQSTTGLVPEENTNTDFMRIDFCDRLEMAFTGFSFYSNVTRIFKRKPKPDFIGELNGVRVMSYGYLLLGHTYLFGPLYNECWLPANLLTALQILPKEISFQIVLNFIFNSDSFFLISGTLITYWWLIKFEEKGKKLDFKSIVYYIVHRYWRLMPHLMLGLMLYTTCYKYLGDGPMFPPLVGDAENCRTNWWPNLLMVNNFVNTDRTCFTWMWYPAVIFQLHVVSLVVLIPLVMKRMLGYAAIVCLYIIHIGSTAGVLSDVHDVDGEGNWYWDYLVTPWCRAGPFIIGLALGILLFRHRSEKFKIPMLFHLAGWAAALALILGVVFATHDKYKEDADEWSTSAEIAYDLLSRNVWALGLAWVVFACHTGHGGVISALLSYPFWEPLSKLVYVSLPTHSMIIFALMYSRHTPIYITTYHQMYRVIGHFWLTLLIGLLLGCLFHYPLSIGLERALLAKSKLQWLRTGCHPEEDADEMDRILNPPPAEPATEASVEEEEAGGRGWQGSNGYVEFMREESVTSVSSAL